MAWEIGNEPRAFSNSVIPQFEKNMHLISALIKSIDKNHLLTTGSEGQVGSQGSMELFERIHAQNEIDYLTIHIWPQNWAWIDTKNMNGTLEKALSKTKEYIKKHEEVAKNLKKPLVIEEFGFPRDSMNYAPGSTTKLRDTYYNFIFNSVYLSSKEKGIIGGLNFWAFGGFGTPSAKHDFWFKPGDEYLGDPPCERQGLNSVYSTDSTFELISNYYKKMKP
jgi:mannan endo-1,4-beta-mannosidase